MVEGQSLGDDLRRIVRTALQGGSRQQAAGDFGIVGV